VIIEGMAEQKPVVATNGGGVPEIVQDGITGLLVPMGDALRMAKAIDYLSTHQLRRPKWAFEEENARKHTSPFKRPRGWWKRFMVKFLAVRWQDDLEVEEMLVKEELNMRNAKIDKRKGLVSAGYRRCVLLSAGAFLLAYGRRGNRWLTPDRTCRCHGRDLACTTRIQPTPNVTSRWGYNGGWEDSRHELSSCVTLSAASFRY
jgi:hypothetical protein